jgi:hypothetical protein
MIASVYLLEEEPLEGEVSGPWTKIGYTKNPRLAWYHALIGEECWHHSLVL